MFLLLVLIFVKATWGYDTDSNWAVLIAGSNGYYNYRHQSDVSHAYHILKDLGGFPAEKIIVFMYDDIANNSANPYPGQIFNEPNGVNYYEGVVIDYKGAEVTASNFLSVLKGIPPKENGKVLRSKSTDNVFIYYSDHGATGLVAMPTGNPLYADDLIDALEYMHQQQMYRNLVFYLEACESGSMFDGILPQNLSIYATTAANPTESSFAYYYNASVGTYLADEYSVRWMQDSEANWQNEPAETLLSQFTNVVDMVKQSHPQMYGDFDIDNETIEEFQAFDIDHAFNVGIMDLNDGRSLFADGFDYSLLLETDKHDEIALYVSQNASSYADSRNVKLLTLYHQLAEADGEAESARLMVEIIGELAHRFRVDIFFKDFVKQFTNDGEVVFQDYNQVKNFACLKSAYAVFESVCEPFSDYSLKYVRALVNLCQSYPPSNVLGTLSQMCYYTY